MGAQTWTTPADLPVGHIVTTAEWQNYVTNNLLFLKPFFTKTTPKAVSGTVAETDLFNNEGSVPANSLSTTNRMWGCAFGDYKQNSGASAPGFRFKFKFGSSPTTVADTGVGGATICGNSANRYFWRADWVWQAIGATNSQILTLRIRLSGPQGSGSSTDWTTGEGRYDWPALGMGEIEGGASTAIDTTAAQNLQLTVINGSATTTDCTLLGAFAVFG